jgi:periplasmic protein TonB
VEPRTELAVSAGSSLANTGWGNVVVAFNAIINKQGHVEDLELVSGPSALYESAAMRCCDGCIVPPLINGEPMEMVTKIDVNYTLNR